VSARPHPPRRGATPEPPNASEDAAPRFTTPLSWQATRPTPSDPGGAGLADAVDEEISDEFLEPLADSVPLALPPLAPAEPLASVLPASALVAPPAPAAPKRPGSAAVVAVAAAGVVAVGWFLTRPEAEGEARGSVAAQTPSSVVPESAAAVPANPALRVPLPPLELDIGVPEGAPAPSSEPQTPDPSSMPPVAPSGILPARPQAIEHPPFDSAAATAALSGAATAATGCRKDGDPAGVASVIVRFAPSGRATSAIVESGPFAGTVTGGCIATTFRKARVPPFTGDYVSVKKTISLR
jgi:hypothetical protein